MLALDRGLNIIKAGKMLKEYIPKIFSFHPVAEEFQANQLSRFQMPKLKYK